MTGIWDVWSNVIKKAKGHALLLAIMCLFFLGIAIFARTGNQILDYFIVAISLLFGFGVFVLILISRSVPVTPTRRRQQPKEVLYPKGLICPGCHTYITPRKVGKMTICPYCSYEFEPQLDKLEKFVKIIKKANE